MTETKHTPDEDDGDRMHILGRDRCWCNGRSVEVRPPYKQEGDEEFWVVFNYSEWLDAQGVIVANDDRSHWQLVQQWQTEKRAKEAGDGN